MSNIGFYFLVILENGNSYFSIIGFFISVLYIFINIDFFLCNYDVYYGEIQFNMEVFKGIIFILMGFVGGIVLGIDYLRRIVYWGDMDIGSLVFSLMLIIDNCINNNFGIINNNVFKFIVNVFVWIVEIVLYGE